MKRMHHAGIALAVIAAVLVSLCAGCSKNVAEDVETAHTTGTPVVVTTAMRGTIEDTLELTGTAQADDEVDVVPEIGGKVTRVYADVGDWVRRGQRLVQLDTQLASAQAGQASAGVTAAQASLEQARTSRDLTDSQTAIGVKLAEAQLAAAREMLKKAEAAADLTKSTVDTNIVRARTGVQSAENMLAEIKAGARDQQRVQAQAQVDQAKSALDLAQQTYQRYQKLFDGGAVAELQLDQMRTQYEIAQAQHRQALQALSLTEEGARTEQVRQAELGVQAAQDQLLLAEAARGQITIAGRDVQTAREGVRQAQEGLNAAIANRDQVAMSERTIEAASAGVGQATAARSVASLSVAKHTVYAPVAGLVASRMVDQGEGASPGYPVMRIVNINPIRIEATVNEMDIARVRTGDRGVVTLDGLADEQFVGTVTDIAPQTSRDTRNYTVRLLVDNATGAIKPGMFARIQLVLDSRSDSVLITRDALIEDDGHRLVYVVPNGQVEVREVTVGAISGNIVEIVEGVAEGERVIVTAQSTLADGEKVTPTERGTDADADAHDAP